MTLERYMLTSRLLVAIVAILWPRWAYADLKTILEYQTGAPNPTDKSSIFPLSHKRYRLVSHYCSKRGFFCVGPSLGMGTLSTRVTTIDTSAGSTSTDEVTFLHSIKYYQFSLDQEVYPLYVANKSGVLPLNPYVMFRSHLNSYSSSALSEVEITEFDKRRAGTTFSYEYGIGFQIQILGRLGLQFSGSIAQDAYPVGDESIKFASQLLTMAVAWEGK